MEIVKRVSRHITNKDDIEYVISLDDSNITQSVVMELFGEFNGVRKFNPYDTIEIPKDSYGPDGDKNIESFITTIGTWIFNRFFIEPELFNVFHYIDEEVTQDTYNNINKYISYALMEDMIDLDNYKIYTNKCQYWQQFSSILAPAYSDKMLCCSSAISKKRDELLKTDKYKDLVASGDEVLAAELEKELLNYALEYLKDDPGMDMYLSGARGSLGNNFKNMFVMRGAIKDPDPLKGYNIVTDNYADGISKDNYALMASALINGPYSRGKKTQEGGYWEKLFIAAYQHIYLDEPGTDCGTKKHITVDLDKSNIQGFMYSYIIESDGSLIELNSQNMDKYINKRVKFRFAALCENEHPCNACAGNSYYKLNIKRIGATAPQVPSIIKNISMQSFHNTVVQIAEMDIEKAFGFKD